MTRLAELYVIIDPDACHERPAAEVARLVLEGGARVVQLRDKVRDKGEQLGVAREIARLCHERDALFIINDHADLALAAGADGVHLGQTDLPVAAVRAFAGDRLLIGVSTNNAEEARRAEADGAGYVAVGAIFPTASKQVTRPADVNRIRAVKAAVSVPVVAIGGINASNIDSVIEAGADAAAVIRAVCAAADPRAVARELASRFAR